MVISKLPLAQHIQVEKAHRFLKTFFFKIKSITDILNMENKTKTNLLNTNLIFNIKT